MSGCTKVQVGLCLHCRGHSAGQGSIKIQILDRAAVLAAVPEQVREILGGNIALLLDFGDLLLASAKVLNILRDTGLKIGGRHAQHAANFSRNPIGI
jgi:hypothetical protein